MLTKTELNDLARQGCILCRKIGYKTYDVPAEIHHIRRLGMKRDNAPVIPLCAHHHRLGFDSVHGLGKKGFAKHWGFTEEDLLDESEKSRHEPQADC